MNYRKHFLLAAMVVMGPFATAVFAQKLPPQPEVLQAMRQANDYFMKKWPDPGVQIVTNIARPSHIWTRAVYYEGLMALYSIDQKKDYYDYAVDWGVKHQWTPRNGTSVRNADDQCCGQTYIDLFNIDPRPERVATIKATIDNMVKGGVKGREDDEGKGGMNGHAGETVKADKCDDWHWIDAIQMAMPVFTRLGVLYHDTAYFRKMYDLYHFTKYNHGGNGLYNQQEHLWWRDKDFVPPYREPNGQNCYWSRGNGWVLAALVRVLSLLPLNEPHRAEYVQDYLDMVHAIVPCQRADGYWNASLHDSTHFGGKELTGTALFTYGIAWGIKMGYLDKKGYLPVVVRSWDAMVKESLHPNGFLGWVQGTGKEPKDGQPVTYDKVPDFEDYGLGCFLLAGSEVYQIASGARENVDESKVPPYQEPNVLQAADGHVVSSAREWEKVQRPYIYGLFEHNVYGRMPTGTVPVTYTTESVDSLGVEGVGIRKSVTIHFKGGDTGANLRVVLYLPAKARKAAPVFVGYSFGGNETLRGSSQWPLKEILARGYGVASAWYWDIEPDRNDGWQTGIRTSLAGVLHIEPSEWGAIGAWAWGLNRIADYLQTEKGVDVHRLMVFGHSRLGKTALWAAATDPRWALVISNESGEGGAALSKRDFGETVAIINVKFPYWFSPVYKSYGSDVAAMPVDQHMLLGLMAPRPLYVASAAEDLNSDPKGEFLGAQGAGVVYSLYGKKGVGNGRMPEVGHPVGDVIRYHIRSGKHDITLYDWQQYMDFADHMLKIKR